MNSRFFNPYEDVYDQSAASNSKLNMWKMKSALKQQKKQLQKRMFGQHYNYSKIGLNKQKKFMIQQQRNTQIERSNRILLEKIQRIAKRSVPALVKKRILTQQYNQQSYEQNKIKLKNNKLQQLQSTTNKSYSNIRKVQLGELISARNDKKILFNGSKMFDSKLIKIKTYIQNNIYVIESQIGKIRQKIKIDIQNYKKFYKQYLEGQHAKVLDYLKYNGSILQLITQQSQKNIPSNQQQCILPAIDKYKQRNNQTSYKSSRLDTNF